MKSADSAINFVWCAPQKLMRAGMRNNEYCFMWPRDNVAKCKNNARTRAVFKKTGVSRHTYCWPGQLGARFSTKGAQSPEIPKGLAPT